MLKNFLLTGFPGCGKTTLIQEIAGLFPQICGGFYTREIREKGERTGFLLTTLAGESGIFAHQDFDSPFRVGKYGVKLELLERLGVSALEKAMQEKQLIIIDEIGKMELFSPQFVSAVNRAFEQEKPVLATILSKPHHFCDRLKQRPDTRVFGLSREKQTAVKNQLLNALKSLGIF